MTHIWIYPKNEKYESFPTASFSKHIWEEIETNFTSFRLQEQRAHRSAHGNELVKTITNKDMQYENIKKTYLVAKLSAIGARGIEDPPSKKSSQEPLLLLL